VELRKKKKKKKKKEKERKENESMAKWNRVAHFMGHQM
jgi:hypothetical protein